MVMKYITISLNTNELSVDNYRTFLDSLRLHLKGGTSHDIPVLRNSLEITDANKFVEVELFYYDDTEDEEEEKKKVSITLALYVLNIYVIGYKSGTQSFFFEEAPSKDEDLLFDGTTKQRVKVFSSSYDKLADRSVVPLSTEALQNAIRVMYDFKGKMDTAFKESLVVVIQMVAEATRFRNIQQYIEYHLADQYTPEGDTISYEDAWGPLSEQIQLAPKNGKFKESVKVKYADNSIKTISRVQEVKPDIAILLPNKH